MHAHPISNESREVVESALGELHGSLADDNLSAENTLNAHSISVRGLSLSLSMRTRTLTSLRERRCGAGSGNQGLSNIDPRP